MRDKILESYDEVLFADGFDDAIIGFEPNMWKVVYSRRKCVDILIQTEGMSEEDAIDYLEYNTFNAYVGDNTPLWVDDFDSDVLRLMYDFVTKFDKDLKKAYKSIPKKDRLVTYEQFIVAQFSNLIDQ
jgi:hypothetical protein